MTKEIYIHPRLHGKSILFKIQQAKEEIIKKTTPLNNLKIKIINEYQTNQPNKTGNK